MDARVDSSNSHLSQRGQCIGRLSRRGQSRARFCRQVTCDLRRLRLHGLTERIPKTHRYRITAKGLRTAIFYTGLYNRSLRTGLAIISPDAANPELPMAKSIRAAETAVNKWHQQEKIAA